MGTNRYLVRPAADSWILEHDGDPIESLATREDALDVARSRAQHENGEVIIVDAEGRVADHQRYGSTDAHDSAG